METIDNLIKDLVLRFSYLGVKQIAQSGTTLIGPAPFIASEAWLNSLYAPLSQAEINMIENELDCLIPTSYKTFLLQVSNGLDILCRTLCDKGTVLLSRYCISSFMTRSNNNCRTAMVAPAASDSIREAHSYEYDNNGNEVIIITPRSGAKDNPVSSDRLDTLKIVKTNKYEA